MSIDSKAFNLISYGIYVVSSFRQGKPFDRGQDKPPDAAQGKPFDRGSGEAVKPAQGKLNGQIATTVFQVTAQPPLVAVSLNCQNLTHELIQETKKFSVAVLSQEASLKFIGIFGFKCGRSVEKYSGLNYEISPSGTPKLLDYSLAHLDVEVTQAVSLGTHTLFIGRVVDSQVLSEGTPMTYEYYHKIKGGLIQQNAPSYVK